METFWRDVRYATRVLWRRPAYTAVIVLTLALGIGANTAIFTMVNSVLLRPLPFAQPERVMQLEETHSDMGRVGVTGATFLDLKLRNRSFTHLAAFRTFPIPFALTGEGRPESVLAGNVTEDFFGALGITPLYGRVFQAEDFQPGAPAVAVFSEKLWRKILGGDPQALNHAVKLNDTPFIVIGVVPDEVRFPAFAELWVPLKRAGIFPENRRSHLLGVLGRLQSDVTVEQASSEMQLLSEQLDKESGGVDAGFRVGGTTLHARMVDPVKPALLVLMGAVGLLLLVACVNVASLALARGVSREREMAVRAALGASRTRLAAQVLAESLVLSLLGGACGMAVAWWGVKALMAMAPANLPRLEAVSLDARVLLFAVGVALGAAVLFGLWPALRASRTDLQAAVQEGARGSAGGRRGWRQVLVAGEVAMALVLLAGAALLGRSFVALMRVDLGFDAQNVMSFSLSPTQERYRTLAATVAFFDQVQEHLRTLPGVEAVALSNSLPTVGAPGTTFETEARPLVYGQPELGADVVAVSADYFRMMRIPILQGRALEAGDREGAPVVVVLSELAARTFFPGEDAIGKRITMRDWNDPLPAVVVGIAADVHQRSLAQPFAPAVYFSYAQFADRIFGLNVLLRTSVAPSAVVAPAAERVWSVDKDQPLSNLRTLAEVMAAGVAQQRFNTLVLGIFAGLGLMLALVGIYGVTSYAVNERTQEIGIRMALGAERGHILRLVLAQGMLPVAVGVVAGLAGALATGRLLQSLLFKVQPTDAGSHTVVALALTGVALLACVIPARRAARVDPMVALRYE